MNFGQLADVHNVCRLNVTFICKFIYLFYILLGKSTSHCTYSHVISFFLIFHQPIYGYGSLEDMLFRSTNTKDGDIFFVEDKEIGLRELAMNVAIPTDPGQRTVKGDM